MSQAAVLEVSLALLDTGHMLGKAMTRAFWLAPRRIRVLTAPASPPFWGVYLQNGAT